MCDGPQLLLGLVTNDATGIDLIFILRADVMVEKIVEKVANNVYEILELLVAGDLPLSRELGRPVATLA